MSKNVLFTLLVPFLLSACVSERTEKYVGILPFDENVSANEKVRMAAHVVPTPSQLEWQKMEKTCFICYGINTFTDREWGTGKEDLSLFNPTELNAEQWASVAKKAGMKMILLTCKHHDGFCLWPSKYTDFSVASTPWKNGKGDIVKEVADACKKEGLKFAVYLSPWDMNNPTYGTEAYNDFFVNQLTELLTQYGRVDEVWFDGACGEGPNGKKQVYDFQRYYKVIRNLQPNAVIAVMGPDVRWVGTETGYGRDTEWSVIPTSEQIPEKVAEASQQKPGSGTFMPRHGDATEKDLGSRQLIEQAHGLAWYPSEVDVSIRPGWYYHTSQDEKVKSPQKLIDIYYSSVGKNSLLLLNLPPDKRGLIHENDCKNLFEMTRILNDTFDENLLNRASSKQTSMKFLTDNELTTYWSGENNELVFEYSSPIEFDRVLLQENITEGQRIEHFKIEYEDKGQWKLLTEGTTVGYKRLLRTKKVSSDKIRLTIIQTRDIAQLAEIGFYLSSPEEN